MSTRTTTASLSDWVSAFAEQRPRARELYGEARRYLAGGVGHDLRHNPVAPTYIARAAGSRKWDVDGNQYIDYGMGNAALLLGHAHPAVVDAIRAVVERGWHFGNDHPQMIEWAALICELIPSAERVRFTNSGTEGTMLALRLARAFTGRTKVLRFEGHFSGWHDSVGRGAALPFDAPVSLGVPPATLETIVIIPADLDVVEATLRRDRDIAAVMLEPSGASWGTVPLSADFNHRLRELTARHEVPLIYDEVITGFRYGPGGYQGLVGVTPDLSVLGKVVSGGMPGAAVVGRAEIMRLFDYTGEAQHDRYQRVAHLGTFNANPLSVAAGLATLRIAADGAPQQHADRMADLLRCGMGEVLDELEVAGFVYGDASIFHVYLEAYPGSGADSRAALRTSNAAILKGIPGSLVDAFQRNLQIRGMDLLSYTGGVTSAAHSEADIQQSLDCFRGAMRTLVEQRLVGHFG
ncbi:MAG: aminotransferase class III-fold pyridoxal phosphate-dependent enzyme [Chloroflexota bacterium]|nr:aminotransferase class III-fold pyridoxal phosphate-dependent enzyme [Chloroflexota bacterium]